MGCNAASRGFPRDVSWPILMYGMLITTRHSAPALPVAEMEASGHALLQELDLSGWEREQQAEGVTSGWNHMIGEVGASTVDVDVDPAALLVTDQLPLAFQDPMEWASMDPLLHTM